MATEQRLKAAFEAADAPKAALALAKLEAVAAVSIKGHPDAILNGIFKVDSEHADGRLVLKNDKGGHCHRYAPHGRWNLTCSHDTVHRRTMSIAAPEGPLPVGLHRWGWCIKGGRWQEQKLMVAEMVRHPFRHPSAGAPELRFLTALE